MCTQLLIPSVPATHSGLKAAIYSDPMPAGVRVADDLVPAVDRNLAGDDDRSGLVAILDDLQEIAALLGVERLRSPVVEAEQVEAGERAQPASVAAVGAGASQGSRKGGGWGKRCGVPC